MTLVNLFVSVHIGLFLLSFVLPTSGGYIENQRRLYNDIIEVNNPWLRPSTNSSTATSVTVMFFKMSSISLNDVEQTMITSGFLGITWTDQFLTWDAGNYSAIVSMYPDPNKIWRPTLAVKNSRNKATPFRADFMYTTVTARGQVLWYPGDVFETVCQMDVTNFPFDTHVCHIDLTLWRSSPDEVDLLLSDSMNINMDEFVKNNEWKLLNFRTERINNTRAYPFVRMEFALQRRASKFVINVIGPIFTIALLNVFIFLIPSQSGEKVQFGVLVLLGYAIFMSYNSESLPDGWNTASTLGNYFLVLQVFCVIYILLSILSATIYSREDYHHGISARLGRIVEIVEKIFLCRCCKKERQPTGSSIQVSPADEPCSHNGQELSFGTKRPLHFRRIPERVEMTWKRVSRAFDIVFFWLFLVIVVLSMIGVMVDISPER